MTTFLYVGRRIFLLPCARWWPENISSGSEQADLAKDPSPTDAGDRKRKERREGEKSKWLMQQEKIGSCSAHSSVLLRLAEPPPVAKKKGPVVPGKAVEGQRAQGDATWN